MILGGVFPLKRPKMTPRTPPGPPPLIPSSWPGTKNLGGQWERRGLMGLKVHLWEGGSFNGRWRGEVDFGGGLQLEETQKTPQDPPPKPSSRPDTHSLGGAMGEKGFNGLRIPYRGRGGASNGRWRGEVDFGGGLQLKDPQNDPPGPPQCPHQGLKPTSWGGGQWERRGLMGLGAHIGGVVGFKWEVEERG